MPRGRAGTQGAPDRRRCRLLTGARNWQPGPIPARSTLCRACARRAGCSSLARPVARQGIPRRNSCLPRRGGGHWAPVPSREFFGHHGRSPHRHQSGRAKKVGRRREIPLARLLACGGRVGLAGGSSSREGFLTERPTPTVLAPPPSVHPALVSHFEPVVNTPPQRHPKVPETGPIVPTKPAVNRKGSPGSRQRRPFPARGQPKGLHRARQGEHSQRSANRSGCTNCQERGGAEPAQKRAAAGRKGRQSGPVRSRGGGVSLAVNCAICQK